MTRFYEWNNLNIPREKSHLKNTFNKVIGHRITMKNQALLYTNNTNTNKEVSEQSYSQKPKKS